MPVFARIVLIVTCLGGGVARAEPPRVAIVIDDVGFQWQLDQRAMALDPPVALAIIPEGPLAGYLARQAEQQNREVWVHLPMAGLNNDNCQSGLTCLNPSWGPLSMRNHLVRQLSLVPGAVGINNHQGSLFTSDARAVTRLVNAIELINRDRSRPLIVMDSRTSPSTRLEQIARRGGLATLSRRVFLDHSDDPDDLPAAWARLIDLAYREGAAIAIGHSRAATLDFLELAIGELVAEGIDLVPPSALVDMPGRAANGPLPLGTAGAYPP